jgi:hypothetical protein
MVVANETSNITKSTIAWPGSSLWHVKTVKILGSGWS